MSKARARRERPSNNPVSPKEGSPGWDRVIARGCGGYRIDTPNGTEYDCSHQYDWACDYCPCCIKSQMEEEARRVAHVMQLAGPPRDRGGRILWAFPPAVAAELMLWYSMEDIAEFIEVFSRLGVVVNLVPASKDFFDLELPW